jgi:hypothetical protein
MSITPSEREELEAGLASGFWLLFKQHAEQEWGPAGERYTQAVQQAAEMKDENAMHTLRMVIFAQREMQRLLAWPAERLNRLKGHNLVAPEGYQSRRGGL